MKAKVIVGIIILASAVYWPLTGIGGLEWIAFIAQIVIGGVLIAKSRGRKSAKVSKDKVVTEY